LELKEIKKLEISFLGDIQIPEEIGKIKIGRFQMSGMVTESEIERICKLLPKTRLRINDKEYNDN
jgi:hypothetical protein